MNKGYLKKLNSFFKRSSKSRTLQIQTDPDTLLSPTSNQSFQSDIDELRLDIDLLSVRSDVSIEIPDLTRRDSDLMGAINADSSSHGFGRSDSGPRAIVPVGGPFASQRGRFSIVREEIESSLWGTKVRKTAQASRFYHG